MKDMNGARGYDRLLAGFKIVGLSNEEGKGAFAVVGHSGGQCHIPTGNIDNLNIASDCF